MLRAWTKGAADLGLPTSRYSRSPQSTAQANPSMHSPTTTTTTTTAQHTYKGNAGGQEKDPHQEVFKLL